MGGLYKNVKMSQKAADLLVLSLVAVTIAVTVFLVSNGGFIVNFNSGGGTVVEPQKLNYGQTVAAQNPVREGYTFDGWFLDPDCTVEWDTSAPVTESMTLYAKWRDS